MRFSLIPLIFIFSLSLGYGIDYTVTTNADAGAGSLREGIEDPILGMNAAGVPWAFGFNASYLITLNTPITLNHIATFDTSVGDIILDGGMFMLTGVGGITKSGNNTLSLVGYSTYTGGTIISDGTLESNGVGVPSASLLTMMSGATFEITGNQTIAGLDGVGTVETGTKNLTINVATSTESYDFVGSINGNSSATLMKQGAGIQTIEGDVASNVSVEEGTLAVTGDLARSLSISEDGIFLGQGIINGVVDVEGGLGPNLLGALTINDIVTLYEGSSLNFAINSDGQCGSLIINDHLIMPFGPLYINITSIPGRYDDSQTYTLVRAQYINPNRQLIFNNSSLFIYQGIITDNNEIILTAIRQASVSGETQTLSRLPVFEDKSSVENLKDYLAHLSDERLLNFSWSDINNRISGLSDEDQETLLAPFDPNTYLALRNNSYNIQALNTQSVLANQMSRRLLGGIPGKIFGFSALRGQSQGHSKAHLKTNKMLWGFDTAREFKRDNSPLKLSMLANLSKLVGGGSSSYKNASPLDTLRDFNFENENSSIWVEPLAQTRSQKHQELKLNLKDQSLGVSLGGDHWVSDSLLLGVSTSYGHNTFKWNNEERSNVGQGRLTIFSGTFYNTIVKGNFSLDSSITAGQNTYKSTRHINASRVYTLAQSHGSFVGWGDLKLSYHNKWRKAAFEPFGRVSYMVEKETQYKETDNDGISMQIDQQTFHMMRSEIGLWGGYEITREDMDMVPQFKVSFIHKKPSSASETLYASFVGCPGRFVSKATTMDKNFISYSVGLAAFFGSDVSFSAHYNGEFATNERRHDLIFKIRYKF